MTRKAALTEIITTMTTKRDWHCEVVEPETVIDRNYKNTQMVRRFFKEQIGDQFKFDRPFMAWMTENTGKTMQDAVKEWLRRHG